MGGGEEDSGRSLGVGRRKETAEQGTEDQVRLGGDYKLFSRFGRHQGVNSMKPRQTNWDTGRKQPKRFRNHLSMQGRGVVLNQR